MKSIYIGVCKTREDKRFAKSFRSFTDSIVNKYSVCQMIIKNTFLPDAQNIITKDFLQLAYDYLLLLDDDQWGHTPEMLETLIEADTYVATIKTYSRHYPYVCALARKSKNNFIIPMEKETGYKECDLTGFPMTLIRKDTFNFLEEPYFRPYKDGDRDWNSDVDFFARLACQGIKPIGCFQHCLNHDKITTENVMEHRHKENAGRNAPWNIVLRDIENGSFVIK